MLQAQKTSVGLAAKESRNIEVVDLLAPGRFDVLLGTLAAHEPTALGLAPCALGAGNSDTFAQATGLDYFAETSVGEFILSAG